MKKMMALLMLLLAFSPFSFASTSVVASSLYAGPRYTIWIHCTPKATTRVYEYISSVVGKKETYPAPGWYNRYWVYTSTVGIPTPTPVPSQEWTLIYDSKADIDKDGDIDRDDMRFVSFRAGEPTMYDSVADMDNNGVIDATDFVNVYHIMGSQPDRKLEEIFPILLLAPSSIIQIQKTTWGNIKGGRR